MLPSLSAAAGMYKVNSMLLLKSLEDMKSSDLTVRPNNAANSMHFIMGHMTVTRYELLKLLGGGEMPSWSKLFDRGVDPNAAAEYPGIEEIIQSWKTVDQKLAERLENATEAQLQRKAPFKPPTHEDTILGTINFLAFHETYHTGQLAYIRRLLGYTQLVG